MEYWKEDRCSGPSTLERSVVGATTVNYLEDRNGNRQQEEKQLRVDEEFDEEAAEERSVTEHEDDREMKCDFSVGEYRALIESIRIATVPITLSEADPKRHFVLGVTAATISVRPGSTDGSLASFYIGLVQRTYSAFITASRRARRWVAQEQVVKPLVLRGGCCGFYERPKKRSSCLEVLQPLADIVKIENKVIRDFQRMGRLKSPPQEQQQKEALKNDGNQLCAAADAFIVNKAKDDEDDSGSVASMDLTTIRNHSPTQQESPILPADWQRTPEGYGIVLNTTKMAENHAKALGAPKVPDQHPQNTDLTIVMGNNDQNQEKNLKSVVHKSSSSRPPPLLNRRRSDAVASWQVVSSILSNEHHGTAIAASPSPLPGAVLKTHLADSNREVDHFPHGSSVSSPSKRKLFPIGITEPGAMGTPVLEPFAKSKQNYLPDGYKSDRVQFVRSGAISRNASIGGQTSTDSNDSSKKEGPDQDMDTVTEEPRAPSERGQDLNNNALLGVLSTRFADMEERLSNMETKNRRLKQRLLHLEEDHKTRKEMCRKHGSNSSSFSWQF